MRTIKELLQVMLDNKNHYSSGLCLWAIDLHYNGIINYKERIILMSYINNNRPSVFSSYGAFTCIISGYYWPSGDINPRINWIEKHLKK